MNNKCPTIEELLKSNHAFMGSDWQDDETVKDGMFPGHRYAGKAPCINCNDLFAWGCADGEDITEKTMPLFEQAFMDCEGDVAVACDLYCSRIRKMRPQGACYSSIPEKFWPLFNACGEKRETGFGNPYEPGEYK